MSVGIYLQAKSKPKLTTRLFGERNSESLLSEAQTWILSYCADLLPSSRIDLADTRLTLFCQLHPLAEELELSLTAPRTLTVSAKTSTVGPGYHIFLCEMLKKLGSAIGFEWQPEDEEHLDETGYFFSGDRQRAFDEMNAWLKGLISLFFDGTFGQGNLPTKLCMSMDVDFESESPAMTPLGLRSLEWLRETAQDPRRGRDFFAWWNPDLDAGYFHGRALARMWNDVRWRVPLNDAERGVLQYVADSLDTAYKLDPNLDYPWSEWAEILAFLECKSAENAFIFDLALSEPKIGYRRRDVSTMLSGGWWITLPGFFTDFTADENNDFSSWDGKREVWFTSYSWKGNAGKLLDDRRKEIANRRPELIHEKTDYLAAANIEENNEGNKTWFVLNGSNTGLGCHATCTIVFWEPADREWAIRVWHSLKPPNRKSES